MLKVEALLGNAGFVAKAPPAVVQAERDKMARVEAELAQRREHLLKLQGRDRLSSSRRFLELAALELIQNEGSAAGERARPRRPVSRRRYADARLG